MAAEPQDFEPEKLTAEVTWETAQGLDSQDGGDAMLDPGDDMHIRHGPHGLYFLCR